MSTDEEQKSLIRDQQAELDAVLVYHAMAKRAAAPDQREAFMRIAADEGKHALILNGAQTEKTKSPSRVLLALILGLKRTMKMLSKGEYDSVTGYQPLSERFPNVRGILTDELRHGEIVGKMTEKCT